MARPVRRTVAFGAWAAAATLAVSACGGERGEGDAAEEERARAAAAEVAKNCHNPSAPNEPCAGVEELSRLSPGRWRSRIRLFNGRDVCVTIDLSRFERVGDDLRGVDRTAC